ncbi:hypothetical protein ACH5RR_017939 [Cinchona calisaya]|uniref:Uncharacterized protein n=1 Tax=Cinchona calisaya TaxID=153742 RepID=A0ABD2ZN89_9GENT
MSMDVAADVTSLNSLSFAGMVCIQNQHLMPREEHVHPVDHAEKASSEFEFDLAIPKKHYSADISNGQLLKQTILHPANQSQTGKKTRSKSVMWQDQINHGRSDITESSRDRCIRKSNTKVKIGADKKRTSSGFSQKIFKSFATPCRDCRVLQPTPPIKEQQ